MKKVIYLLSILLCANFIACNDEAPMGLVIDKTSLECSYEQTAFEVMVKGVTDWQASSDQTWCEITNANATSGLLTLLVHENDSETNRTAHVRVSANSDEKTITIVQEGSSVSFYGLFTDRSCSALKPDVTIAEIEQISNEIIKGIATQLFNEEYEGAEFRIQQYEPYMPLDELQEYIGNDSPYSKFENPTGIRKKSNEEIHIFAEGIGTYDVRVLVANLGTHDGIRTPGTLSDMHV